MVHYWLWQELWHCMAWDVLLQVLQQIFWCTFYGLKIILLASSSVCKIAWELQINFCDLSNKDYSTSAQVLEYYWQIKRKEQHLINIHEQHTSNLCISMDCTQNTWGWRCGEHEINEMLDFVPFGHDNNQVLYIHVKRSLIYMHE